jgi:Mg2+-importing ATPase
VAIALILPLSVLAPVFQFEAPPITFFAWLAGMLLSYLLLVEGAKRFFYARLWQKDKH